MPQNGAKVEIFFEFFKDKNARLAEIAKTI